MTIKQIQNLLQYLGYYSGIPDGIAGPLTREATEAFQRDFGGIGVDGDPGKETQKALLHAVPYGIPERDTDGADTSNTPDIPSSDGSFWDGIRYWSRAEFACRCGEYHEPYCDGYPAEPDETLVELLDDIRAHFGRPAHRSSGLRCPQHNRDSKGEANSRHLYGKAMDFYVEGVSGEAVRAYADADPRCNYTYVIEGNYVHVDVK